MEMTIDVTDDGKGFLTDAPQTGTGLKNLASRVKSVDGAITISDQKPRGASIHITIPLHSRKPEKE